MVYGFPKEISPVADEIHKSIIVKQNLVPAVDGQHAVSHTAQNGFQFIVTVFQLFHSRFQPTGHPVERVRQLTDLTVLSGFQPDSVTALGNLPGRLDDLINGVCNEPGKSDHQPSDQQNTDGQHKNGGSHIFQPQGVQLFQRHRHPQYPLKAVRPNRNGAITIIHAKGAGTPDNAGRFPCHGFFYFLPILMIFHVRRAFLRFPQHGAIHVDNGDTDFLPPSIFFCKGIIICRSGKVRLLKHVPDQFCLICILRLTLLLQKTLAAAPEGDLGSHQRHKYKCYICK